MSGVAHNGIAVFKICQVLFLYGNFFLLTVDTMGEEFSVFLELSRVLSFLSKYNIETINKYNIIKQENYIGNKHEFSTAMWY